MVKLAKLNPQAVESETKFSLKQPPKRVLSSKNPLSEPDSKEYQGKH